MESSSHTRLNGSATEWTKRTSSWNSISSTGFSARSGLPPSRWRPASWHTSNRLRRVGLEEITAGELEELIHDKITSNYLYNLEINEQYGVTKFNIMIELPGDKPYKLVLALKYHPEHHRISLITCF